MTADGLARGRLDGRRALVIGGGSGIGRGVVDAFVAEGADVAVLELDAAKCDVLAGVTGGPVLVGDATSRLDVEAAVASTVSTFGGLDTLVTCVGRFDYYLGLADLDDDVVDDAFVEAMDVNVRSCLLAVRAALGPLRASRGSVVVTASTSSFRPGRGGILYVASKFALRGCVVSLAEELAPEVRVNGVAPGGTVGTDLRGLTALGQDDRSLGRAPSREDSIRARSPLEVALTPADHAACYVFLASDAARGMTGHFLHPDGGANVG